MDQHVGLLGNIIDGRWYSRNVDAQMDIWSYFEGEVVKQRH